MKLKIRESYETDNAKLDLKNTMTELKHKVAAYLKDRDVSVYVERSGSTGYSIGVVFNDPNVSEFARGRCFPYLNVRIRKQRNGEIQYYLYTCSTGTSASTPVIYDTWDECRDGLLSSGLSLIVDETNDAFDTLDAFKRRDPDAYKRYADTHLG